VALSPTAKKYRREVRDFAENVPIRQIALPEYKQRSFEPDAVRQERTYARMEAGMPAITRFLVERGTVELLKPAQVRSLFTEMHWCGYQLHKLARSRDAGDEHWRASANEARRLMSRMEAAEEELFIANRRLIVRCCKPYFWVGGVWMPDFLQEGSKALSNAIRKFDFTRGTPFYAYAQRAIQNRLRNFLRDHIRSGSIAVRPTAEMMKVKEALEAWKEEHDAEPDNETLARLADVEPRRLTQVLQFIRQSDRVPSPPVSLDAMLGEQDTNLHDLIEDTDADRAENNAQLAEIWEAIDQLPERSRKIMRLRFVEGRTLEETGQQLSLTRARIKQIQDESVKKLRGILKPREVDEMP
jgi:RNA polymerase sigma factor (sigma-70 family)